MKKMIGFMFAVFLVVPGAALAQEKPAAQAAPAAQATPPANPITMSEKGFYGFVSGAVISAAQKMPEENYSFKPTPEVRSFGQIVGHVADASYSFCSQVSGEANPATDIEKTKTSKADLVSYREMLAGIRDRVQKLISQKKTVEQAVAAKPTAAWDAKWGNGFIKPDDFVKSVYTQLSAKK